MADILINDDTPREQYTATGGQTTFPYTWPIYADADLKVYLTPNGSDPDDASDILVLTTDYTVTGAGVEAGGNVVLNTGATAGDVITIVRDMADARTSDYDDVGDLAGTTLNTDLDKIIMLIQQLETLLGRSLTLGNTSQSSADLTLPDPVASKLLAWNSAGTALELVSNAAGDTPSFVSVQFSGGTGDQGTVSWNTDEETLDLIMNGSILQMGQETHWHVRNNTGSTISNGTPVMATGTLGASGRITVAPMDGTSSANAIYLLGVATEDIAAGTDGKVTHFGKVRGLDTTAWTEGDVLYISTTVAGEFQNTEPTGTDLNMPIAFVITDHATNGVLAVRIASLDENHFVQVAGNQTIAGNKTFTGILSVNSGNSVILNADVTGTPSANAAIEVERGTSANAVIQWNETDDLFYAGISGALAKILTESHTIGDQGCRTVLSSNQTLTTGSAAAVAWDSDSAAGAFDPLGMHDHVSDKTKVYIPSGWTKVEVVAGVVFQANSTGDRYVEIKVNTTRKVTSLVPAATLATHIQASTGVLEVVGGTDYIEVYAYQNSGGNVDLDAATYPFLSVRRVA